MMLAVLGFFSTAVLISADVQDHPSRSVSIEPSAHLRDHDAAGADRINLGAGGVTLMEGASLDKASARAPAGLIRREASAVSTHRSEVAESELEEVEIEKHGAKVHKAATKAVSWDTCDGGRCQCFARRRVVIRYQRERAAGAFETQENVMTNWHYRVRQRPYNETPPEEFSQGFSGAIAANLQMCGGDRPWSKDCLVKPQPCTFDTVSTDGDTNTYDAKAGEYCCNADLEYCSYKCVENEVFSCPSLTTDINFPGGMDPAGPEVYKRCYIAQYAHGLNPESATDADEDKIEDSGAPTVTIEPPEVADPGVTIEPPEIADEVAPTPPPTVVVDPPVTTPAPVNTPAPVAEEPAEGPAPTTAAPAAEEPAPTTAAPVAEEPAATAAPAENVTTS